MRKKLTLLLAAMTLCLSMSALAAEREKEVEIGISGGILLPGSFDVEGYTVDTDLSPMLRFILDAYVAEKFMMGGYVNFSIVSAEDVDETANLFEFGGALKGRFLLSPTVVFKPGLNLGYRIISGDVFDDVKGFGVNFSAEFQFIGDNLSPYIDAGFISQPAGGNSDADVTFAPIIYLTGGIIF